LVKADTREALRSGPHPPDLEEEFPGGAAAASMALAIDAHCDRLAARDSEVARAAGLIAQELDEREIAQELDLEDSPSNVAAWVALAIDAHCDRPAARGSEIDRAIHLIARELDFAERELECELRSYLGSLPSTTSRRSPGRGTRRGRSRRRRRSGRTTRAGPGDGDEPPHPTPGEGPDPPLDLARSWA
jgi:hypothetical protein